MRHGRAASISALWLGCGVVTSFMFDSDDPAVLEDAMFAGCRVATYADLMTPALVARFAGRLVVIDRGHGDPMNLAHVVDVESGALSIAQGAERIKAWNAGHRGHVAVYASRSNLAALLEACAPVKPYQWVATLDGTMNPDGRYPTAVQFQGENAIGKHVDVSVVYDENWVPLGAQLTPIEVHSLQTDAAALVGIAQRISLVAQAV